jgi:uncharacterized repeat protein (TIGR01451 family)
VTVHDGPAKIDRQLGSCMSSTQGARRSMDKRVLSVLLILPALLLTLEPGDRFSAPNPSTAQPLQAPVLKWQHGGCYRSWCETGWYSSPAVADLDSDGTVEIIGGAYSLFILDGETGSLEQRFDTPGSRIWPGVVVADIDGNGDHEIVIAQGGGYVSVYDHEGYYEPGWPQRPSDREFRSLAVDDLDGDGDMEIVVGLARLDSVNVWVFEHTGSVRPGWPQLTGEGSAAGLYNDTIALDDLDGDGQLELVVPSDTITICAYEPDGTQLPTHEMYHDHAGHDMDYWGEVPAYVDLAYETRGWGPCYTEPTARANFANGPANVVDMNGDGRTEVVVIGDVHDCHTSPYTDLYNGPYILNVDRSRFNTDGFDWSTPPVDTGAPLIQDYNVIETVQPNPVTVDLDGDGNLEIVYPSYDGKMHAFWLDKTEHHSWPYAIYTGGHYRFASEPAAADLDDDGHAELIFASWIEKGANLTGRLHILDYLGNPLHEVSLPAAYGSSDWNGALAAPTLANIDKDPDLEVVLNTAHSGFVAYDLPGTENARILWGTGRGNYRRTGGGPLRGTLRDSSKDADPTLPGPGDLVTYTIALRNPGRALRGTRVTDTLPAQLNYRGNLWASTGSYGEAGSVITWTGEVPAGLPVSITFGVRVSEQITVPRAILNTALIDDGLGNIWQKQALIIVNGRMVHLPVIHRLREQ